MAQNGVLYASTALNNQGGSVRLQAWSQGSLLTTVGSEASTSSWRAGVLTLGKDSVILVEPDLSDTSEIEQSSLSTRYEPGRVELRGYDINVKSGASVVVPAGSISIVASAQPLAPLEPNGGSGGVGDGSRILIEDEAYLSVAGLRDVLIAMERNIVEVELRINELRDSPLYRDSWLRGVTVLIDRRNKGVFTDGPMSGVDWGGGAGEWTGTPLADVSAWIGVGKTDLAELSTRAGSIVLKSGGALITRPGSVIDLSGGSIRYKDGWIATSRLLGADGRIYDIGNAMPDQLYIALADGFTRHHARWGVTETWSSPLGRGGRRYERGYTEGRNAGSLSVYTGEAFVLEGQIAAGVVTGERQYGEDAASGGTLIIGDGTSNNRDWIPKDVIITSAPVRLAADMSNLNAFYDAATDSETLYLDTEILKGSGLGDITLYVQGGFKLAEGSDLELDPGAKFSVVANAAAQAPASYEINSNIRIGGGTVSLTGNVANAAFGSGGGIDVSGHWINQRLGADADRRLRVDGGSIDILADAITAAPGAILDVSGGAKLAANGKIAAGDAGAIALKTVDGGSLANLDLRGYSAGSGGKLTITTGAAVQIGGTAPSDPAIMHVGSSLYSDRGFRTLSITSSQRITVADRAEVSQVPVSFDLTGAYNAPTGTAMASVGTLTTLPQWMRAEFDPTEVEFVAPDLTVGAGSFLSTDVRGTVRLNSLNGGIVTVLGTIAAPAGAIMSDVQNGTIKLGNDSALLARGVPVIHEGADGLRIGTVLDGGTVSLQGANIDIAANAVIDVSGTTAVVDVLDNGGPKAVAIGSNGGSLTISASALNLDTNAGNVVSAGGGQGGAGGVFVFSTRAGSNDGTALYNLATTSSTGSFYGTTPTGAAVSLNNVFLANLFANASPEDYAAMQAAISANPGAYGLSTAVLTSARLSIQFRLAFQNALRSAAANGVSLSVRNGASGSSAAYLVMSDPVWKLMLGIMTGDLVPKNNSNLNINVTNKVNLTEIDAVTGKYKYINQATFDTRLLSGAGFSSINLRAAGGALIFADGAMLPKASNIGLTANLIAAGGSGRTIISANHVALTGGTGGAAKAGGGDGVLEIDADLIEISGSLGFAGFDAVNLSASDIQLQGGPNRTTGTLYTPENLKLTAAQIYPTTQAKHTLEFGKQIIVEQLLDVNGQPRRASLPLSAAGSLTVQAPVITQNGTLVAPFGSIALTASNSLTLGAGSVTSVSGAGLTALYGSLLNGELWQAVKSGTAPETITALPEKKITLTGPNITVSKGATVNISGGGDLMASEFVAGPGGSHDILAMSGMYAILPSQASASSSEGTRIWLDGGNGLAAGWYTLLPARYALLPGAYAIQMVKGSTTGTAHAPFALPDGTVVMSGRLGNAFSGTSDALSSTWRVMSGNVVRKYSEYNVASANAFFSSDAFKATQYRLTGIDVATPRLARDGGSVVFNAGSQLVLDGALEAQGDAGGLSGLVDITGTRIAVVGAGAATGDLGGYLLLDAGSLTSFGGSLLIGGVRTSGNDGLHLSVTASDIVVRNDAGSALSAPDVMLAATGSINVSAGSVLEARGQAESSGNLVINPQSASQDWGALIRVSSGAGVTVMRNNADGGVARGTVTIGTNVVLDGRSVLIDATNAAGVTMASSATLKAENLSLASGRIGFGGGAGLVLDAASLAQLASVRNLTLHSYSTIDFFTDVDLSGLSSVTLDAGALVGYGSRTFALGGQTIALVNTSSNFAEPVGAGHGGLAITAENLVLGYGSKALRGFDTVTLTGLNGIVGSGKGSLDAGAAALDLRTAVADRDELRQSGGDDHGRAAPGRDRRRLDARRGRQSGLDPVAQRGQRRPRRPHRRALAVP